MGMTKKELDGEPSLAHPTHRLGRRPQPAYKETPEGRMKNDDSQKARLRLSIDRLCRVRVCTHMITHVYARDL